jgi:hypothetical protein
MLSLGIYEGHIINYPLSFPATQLGMLFESDGSQTSPLARLSMKYLIRTH